MTSEDFERILTEQAENYGRELAAILTQLTPAKIVDVRVRPIGKALAIDADCIASIAFVGTVTGEFIVSFSQADGRSIFADSTTVEEVFEVIGEALNMAAGSCLRKLTALFDKLTIASPKTASGGLRYPHVKNVPIDIRTDRGTLRAYFFIDRMRLDIADSYRQIIEELKSTNVELLSANGKLKEQQAQLVHSEKMASLGTMAAGVAHEINNPLAFVASNTDVLGSYVDAMSSLLIGYEQMLSMLAAGKSSQAKSEFSRINELRKKEDIDFVLKDTRKLLAESKTGLERIRSIVAGLKRFSRVDDSGVKKVQINEELQNTLMLLQNELKYRCQVETDFRATREVECLPGEMSQVFMNLIVNAGQAVHPPNGIVRVSTEDVDGDRVRIRVWDNGSGIAEENLGKIFSPFFTTKPVGEGTGLGLAISHGIVTKHSGTISVKSRVGEGTEFAVEIPILSHLRDSFTLENDKLSRR